jgi:cadmium resistance protein CadD (predicted permease)
MAKQFTNAGNFVTKPVKNSLYGSRLFPKVMQKPIGVGSFVGFLVGVANSIILTIPLLFSVPVGVLLGMGVCIIACPGMRTELAQHKVAQSETRNKLISRNGRKNVFTTYD